MPTTPETPIEQGIAMPEFTDAQIKALTDYMEAAGRSRARAQGAAFSEVDFLVGCMTTLYAIDRADKIPSKWIFTTMGGGSPLGLPDLDRTVFVVHDPTAHTLSTEVTVYENKPAAEDHLQWLANQGNEDAYVRHEPARHAVPARIAEQLYADADADAEQDPADS